MGGVTTGYQEPRPPRTDLSAYLIVPLLGHTAFSLHRLHRGTSALGNLLVLVHVCMYECESPAMTPTEPISSQQIGSAQACTNELCRFYHPADCFFCLIAV